jgi:hypothetical protein
MLKKAGQMSGFFNSSIFLLPFHHSYLGWELFYFVEGWVQKPNVALDLGSRILP